jgi:parallel beta-helix repeat protein
VKKYVDKLFARAMRWGHQTTRRKTTVSGSFVEAMEPRLLYSADLAPLELATEPNQSPTVLNQSSSSIAQDLRTIELVVIDSKVEDANLLLADIKTQQDAGRQVALLQIASDEDGILRVSQTLADLNSQGFQVSAVHFLSHGDDGQFELGNQVINDRALRQSTQSFSSWSLALTTNADILIYGCNFSETERGQTFASNLAAITGADVAGNREQTGALSLGGDWTLDSQTGAIEASAALSATGQASWGHLLALTAQGQPTVVNTTLGGSQSTGSDIVQTQANAESTGGNKIAADSAGNYVIAWIDSGIAKLQFFNANGTPKPSGEITIPTVLAGSTQRQIAVAMNSAGETIATWVEDIGTTTIFACRFAPDGTPLSSFIVTNDFTASKPALAISDSGAFIIAWQKFNAFNGYDINAQLFNASAQPVNGLIGANTNISGNQLRPAVAMRGDVAVVAWHDENTDTIALRCFKLDGLTLFFGNEVQASGITGASQRNAPDVSIDASNLIIVAWQAEESATLHTYYSVFQRGFASVADPYLVKAESRVNPDTPQAQSLPKVALADNGQFVVVQQSANQLPDGAGWGIFARSFAANATALGTTETAVNVVASNQDFSLSNQFAPAVAWRNAAYNIVTAWTTDQPGNSNVLTRQLNPFAEQVFIVNTDNDVVDPLDGLTSLREAIIASNATPNVIGTNDKIQFNIPIAGGGQDFTIDIVTPLPPITGSVDIQGATQAAFNGGTITIRDSSTALGTLFLQRDVSGPLDSSGSSITGLRIRSVFNNALIIQSANNTIANNSFFDSGLVGVEIFGNSFTNAGNNTIENNDIYENLAGGISINNSENNTLKNNRISSNSGAGITVFSVGTTYFSTSNLILENTISENAHGIDISGVSSFRNIVTANNIGINSLGNLAGNLGAGIRIFDGAAQNTIGGTDPNLGNVIAGNGSFGIEVNNTSSAAPSRNILLRNSIYSNSNLGISVDAVESAPLPLVFVAAQSGMQTVIHGGLFGSPNTAHRIELFSSPGAAVGSTSSGKNYLGFVNAISDSDGYVYFNSTVPSIVATGDSVTATATVTDSTYTNFGATSQFSVARSVGLQVPVAEGTTPLINIAAHTRLAPLGGLTFTLNNTHDSMGLTLTSAGILSFSSPADYEALIADAMGANDNILWIYVIVTNGIDTEEVVHIINIQDKNDSPFINRGPVFSAQQGTTVSFLGPNAISIGDPDANPLAAATLLTLTISAELVGTSVNSGQLTFNGSVGNNISATGTISQLNAALASLQFTSDSAETRSIQIRFTLNDNGSGFGAAAQIELDEFQQINITAPVNVAPVISGINPNQIFTENDWYLSFFDGITISDGQQINLTQARVTTTGAFTPSEDSQPKYIGITGGIQAARVGNVLTLTGDFPIADYMAALGSLKFINTSESPTAGVRTFTVEVFDGALWSAAVSTNITVIPIDDFTDLALPTARDVGFGQIMNLTGAPGELYLVDADAGSTEYEMAITVLNGSVFVGSSTGGTEVRVRGTIAQLNNYLQGQVSYKPNIGFSGNDPMTVEIRLVSQVTNMADGAPINTKSMALNVLAGIPPVFVDMSSKANFAENAGPVVLNPLLQITSSNTTLVTSATAQITSGYDAASDILGVTKVADEITVKWDEAKGTLTLTGTATQLQYSLALASLTFNNTSDNPSDSPRQVTLSVIDSLGQSSEAITEIAVEVFNDRPTISSLALIASFEDAAVNFSLANALQIADPDSDQLVLTFSASSGSLRWMGTAGQIPGVRIISINQVELTGSAADINLLASSFQFIPSLDFSGTAEVQWSLVDNQGASDGKTTSIQITPVNDIPVWQSNRSLTTSQGETAAISSNQSRASDIEDGASRLTYELSALPSHGALLMNGNTLTLASNFTQADIDNGAVSYKHNGSNNASDSFRFTVSDSAGGKSVVHSVAISIATTPVIVITPTGGGTGAGTGAGTGTGTTVGNTTPAQTASASTSAVNDTKSVAGNAPTVASESTTAAGNVGTAANSSAQKAVPRNSPSGTLNSTQSDSVQLASGNSASNLSSASRMTDGASSALNSGQQATKSSAVQDTNRAEQGLANGILRTRTAAENSEYVAILRATLNTQSFTEDLQKVRDDATNSLKLDKNVVASTTAVSATLSIGYVIWLVRGGALLSSLLASMPAWKMVDPLPILGSMGGNDDADQDDDSLDAMIEKSKANRIKEKALALSPA